MKKKIALLFCIILLFGCTQKITNEDKPLPKNVDTKTLNMMYNVKDNSYIVFDTEDIDISKIEEDVKKEETRLFSIDIDRGNKAISYTPEQTITTKTQYIGLADSNVAEFFAGGAYFRLNINQDILLELENLGEDQDIEVVIESPENLEGNCVLKKIL